MTRDQKEQLIKDLCARLPYGVKAILPDIDRGNVHKFKSGVYTLDSIDKRGFVEVYEEDMGLIDMSNVKPILFPINAINYDIEVDKQKVYLIDMIHDDTCLLVDGQGDIVVSIDALYIYHDDYPKILDTFHRYHIDYRNLIGQGLAISVFDLPENPYK